MRQHRVRLQGPLARGERRLAGPAAHHLLRVLRLQPGAELVAFDGEGWQVVCELRAVEDGVAVLGLHDPQPATNETVRRLCLAVALPKGDKLADVVRMGTELGVAGFRPFVARRSEVPELTQSKLLRLRRIASEAARQSGRAQVPEVHEALPLARLVWGGQALVATPGAAMSWDGAGALGDDLTVITGPEGGFSEAEVEALTARGAIAVDLGPRILRAETAPVALAAALLLGDAG